jgi:hypothetical protein
VRLDGVWHRCGLSAVALALALVSGSGCFKRGPRTTVDAATNAPRATPKPRTEAAQPSASPAPRATPDVPEEIERSRARIHEVLGLLADRELSASQREERESAVSFLGQIEEALAAGDPERAGVLAEKARILVENLERATRP